MRRTAKVTIDSLLSHTREIDWYQNEWLWPLFRGRIKITSTIASHSPMNIPETVRDKAWFQRTTNIKWPIRNQMVTWPMTSR